MGEGFVELGKEPEVIMTKNPDGTIGVSLKSGPKPDNNPGADTEDTGAINVKI